MNNKIILYQVFTRLYGNRNTARVPWGTEKENGSGKFSDFDQRALRHIKDMGVSHVWLTGVLRHASQTDYSSYGIPRQHPAVVKGVAGSPYAVCDYYDVDPALADNVRDRMHEFEALVTRMHRAGLKVIMDFVPNHVARQYRSVAKPEGVHDLGQDDDKTQGFNPQNNFYYCPGCRLEPTFDLHCGICPDHRRAFCENAEPYHEYPAEATGNDHFDNRPTQNDWYETVKLNYGLDYYTHFGHFDPIPDTWNKMTDILLFWAKKGIDGFRCDMAEMVPAAFWAWATDKVKFLHPEVVFIGEVYDPRQYRNYINSGFDYLYDKVGMYDTLRGVVCGHASARAITAAWQATNDIGHNMLYFLENHDEQRLASDFFAGEGRRGVPALVASVLMNTNPFMLYAAQEYGERGMDEEGFSGRDGRTTIFDYWSLDTLCRAEAGQLTADEQALYDTYHHVLQIARKERAIDGDFYDLMYANPQSADFDGDHTFAFLRKHEGEILLVVCNFADAAVQTRVVIPRHAVDFLAIPDRTFQAVDLLTGDQARFTVPDTGDATAQMTIAPCTARVWKMTYRPSRVATTKKK